MKLRDFLKLLPCSLLTGCAFPGIDNRRPIRLEPDQYPKPALQPLKEVQADVLAIESGFDSRRRIIRADYEKSIEEVDGL